MTDLDLLGLAGFWYALLGLTVGGFGTLIGAGGGFLLMPVFFFLFPDLPAEKLTAVSLAVVVLNAASGTLAYARQGKIHYGTGLLFAAAGIPGALIGARVTTLIPRGTFDGVFGLLLVFAGGYLCLRAPQADHALPWSGPTRKQLGAGAGISVGIGFLSSLLGIGGGIIQVPSMSQLLGYPMRVATATSTFSLLFMSAVGAGSQAAAGNLSWGWPIVAILGPAMILGAQLGARFAPRVKSTAILRALAASIILVGVRLLWGAWSGSYST
ncbi:MAG: sulfite exporter TauE/SafE family protein [Bdellovibrionales bacterium]|nr:sulfite exporter TauE/SafE family protein [Bdellovibrionales bacterium]